jgi:hypothetical protein
VHSPSRSAQQALVAVDGTVFTPAVTSFGGNLAVVGTPAIDSGVFGDVYLTFDAVGGLGASSGNLAINNLPSGSVAIGVVIEPLVAWLWAGGLLVGLGGLLALVPGSRRRATEPASAAPDLVTNSSTRSSVPDAGTANEDVHDQEQEQEEQHEHEPVGAMSARRTSPS